MYVRSDDVLFVDDFYSTTRKRNFSNSSRSNLRIGIVDIVLERFGTSLESMVGSIEVKSRNPRKSEEIVLYNKSTKELGAASLQRCFEGITQLATSLKGLVGSATFEATSPGGC